MRLNKNPMKLYRVLICVLYSLIKNCVWIDYICCQSKTLSSISSYRILEQTGYNIWLGIDIPEVLLSLVYFHGFMEKPNSTVILNCQSRLVNNYLEKGIIIIEKNSKQLISLLNDVKLIINEIDKLEIYLVMAKNIEISSVANTIKKLHIQSDLHFIHKKNLYHDKQYEMDEIFDEYHVPLLKVIYHPALIE